MSVLADRIAFRAAARTSLVASGGPPRPGLLDARDEQLKTQILQARLHCALRRQWVEAITAALCADILAARRRVA